MCVLVFVSLYHRATVPGRQTVWRGGRVGLCVCVCACLCVWSRCAWPPCAACCPSVLPSVCRLRPRSANSTAPRQEDPGERDAERQGEGWKETERQRDGGEEERGGRAEGGAEGREKGGLQGWEYGGWERKQKKVGEEKGAGLWV